MKRHIPNALTMGNLVCGCFGIVYANQSNLYLAAYMVWGAAAFDFLDGYAARAVNTTSALGKQLDSLADMVSFGVLPAMVAFSWLSDISPYSGLAYSAFLMAVCAALRLGKFNLDEQQQHFFMGLPTPANALFITGLVFLPAPLNYVLSNIFVGMGIILLFSFFMVMPVPLFSLKFKNFSWASNQVRFIFILISAVLLGVIQASAISLIILLYIVLSLFTIGRTTTHSNN